MQRLFSKSDSITAGQITIGDKKQIHHIKNVLRFKTGQIIEIFDEQGNLYRGLIERTSADQIIIRIKSRQKPAFEDSDITITVACAIPKKSKMDDIVDKLTQLGVERVIPMQTQRVIVRLDAHQESLRLQRWKKIALNAAEQCQGSKFPVIEPIRKIEEVLAGAHNYDLRLIPALIGERNQLKTVLNSSKPSNIILLIGPEGDFTKKEVNLAVRAGFIPVTLGKRVLRVETAAVAAVSFIRLYAHR
ncbi:MAG: 16S rRNA (uracil(1498)-N(3))-methyltransferase [Candidatus Omnitrophica bacterium]|nr:16S rRNA (uracil(1498)-N(3))-methyltransferase [Candidatus Omnitrophota bacterium]